MRIATDQDGSGVYVETPSRYSSENKLAMLPKSYGGRKGQSRQLVWALTELAGVDPRIWVRDDSGLTTYGGDDYNLLLKFLLIKRGVVGKLVHDSIGVKGLSNSVVVTPRSVSNWASEFFQGGQVPADIARKFREPTSFTAYLSTELSRKEAQASVPVAGFIRWLTECL